MGHVTITLNCRTYRLRCGDGEEPRLLELANHLRQRIDRLSVEFGQVGDDRLLVMAALLATDELLDAKALLAESNRDLPHLGEQVTMPPPPLPPISQKPAGGSAMSAEARWDSAPVSDGAPIENAQPNLAEKKTKLPVQRASLNDRLAEARDGAAPDRRTGSG